jgi:hypothetical protein
MSFVDNNGVRIHYEAEGEGPPLVGGTPSPTPSSAIILFHQLG